MKIGAEMLQFSKLNIFFILLILSYVARIQLESIFHRTRSNNSIIPRKQDLSIPKTRIETKCYQLTFNPNHHKINFYDKVSVRQLTEELI